MARTTWLPAAWSFLMLSSRLNPFSGLLQGKLPSPGASYLGFALSWAASPGFLSQPHPPSQGFVLGLSPSVCKALPGTACQASPWNLPSPVAPLRHSPSFSPDTRRLCLCSGQHALAQAPLALHPRPSQDPVVLAPGLLGCCQLPPPVIVPHFLCSCLLGGPSPHSGL